MWQYTPYTIPLALATVVALVAGTAVWRQRKHPADFWAVGVQLSISAWAATHLFTLTVTALDLKLVGYAAGWAAMAATVATLLGFTLYFTGRGEWVTRSRAGVMLAFPLVVLAVVGTNRLHGLVFVDPHVDAAGSFAVLAYEAGIGWFAILAVFEGTAAVYGGLLFQKCVNSRNVYRQLSAVLFVSVAALTALTLLSGLRVSPHPHFVLLPMGYLFVGVAMIAVTASVRVVKLLPIDRAVAWWQSRFGDIVPLGRDFVVETIDTGIVIMDADGRIVDINRTAKVMMGADRAVGRHLREVARSDRIIDGGPVYEMLRDERALGAMDDELWVDTENGKRYYDVGISAIEGSADEPVGYVLLLHDVTERKHREQALEARQGDLERQKRNLEAQTRKLEHQNERLDDFASIVSHDLRNPLNVANGKAHLALDAAEDGEPVDPEDLRTVVDAHERMKAIIDDALELARQGKAITETESVALATVARQAWATVDTREADLTVSVDRTFEADRGRLLRLFENTFRNSVEHGGDAVAVHVGDLAEGGFYVEDDGPGIPADDRSEVMKHGYTTSEDGTGLGLAIVSDVARAHGWTMRITEGADGGARFEFHAMERPGDGDPDRAAEPAGNVDDAATPDGAGDGDQIAGETEE